jgi:caffeoyl-CoA O-methyltransferase
MTARAPACRRAHRALDFPTMTTEPVPVTAELQEYLLAHSTRPDPVGRELIEYTAALGPVAGMQTAPEQGLLLTMLVQSLGARKAVEVGTFTGLSSLAIARGLAPGGTLLCCDVSEEWTTRARQAWAAAGVADRIQLRIAPALDTLRALPQTEDLDFAFIDADKSNYPHYYAELITRLRPGGLIAVDNVFQNGTVVDSRREQAVAEGRTQTGIIHEFNEQLAADERIDVVMLPIADGLTLARKR